MARGNKRKPKKSKTLHIYPSKQPKGQPTTSDKDFIRWCFRFYDNKSWHDDRYKDESFYEIAKHLKDYQGLIWGDVKRKDHPIKITKIICLTQIISPLVAQKRDHLGLCCRGEP